MEWREIEARWERKETRKRIEIAIETLNLNRTTSMFSLDAFSFVCFSKNSAPKNSQMWMCLTVWILTTSITIIASYISLMVNCYSIHLRCGDSACACVYLATPCVWHYIIKCIQLQACVCTRFSCINQWKTFSLFLLRGRICTDIKNNLDGLRSNARFLEFTSTWIAFNLTGYENRDFITRSTRHENTLYILDKACEN